MGSHLRAEDGGTYGTLPQAQFYVCLPEALGLQFKSLFIDSYKGERELLTCLHSTKSIRIKGTTAELPLPRCGPAGPRAALVPSQLHGHLWLLPITMGLEQGPQLAGPCPPGNGQARMKLESSALAEPMGGSCPNSAETTPQPHDFHGRGKAEAVKFY